MSHYQMCAICTSRFYLGQSGPEPCENVVKKRVKHPETAPGACRGGIKTEPWYRKTLQGCRAKNPIN
ncbi:hypothetical protein O9K51_07955 [Purpureocillium lavendulum]|uniref:Uncharacterized protein n=1 Tax=Purpureocillium lavendulum TaxID=1247861 RepID=A0AB34FKZ7_9HYPO|nr:hypothetical protein O9K51_07955 [Purpureocillium lavendulum]